MVDARDTLSALHADIDRALNELNARRPMYVKALRYGEGRAPEVAASTAAARIVEQSRQTPISFAHIPVEVIAEKIELGSVSAAEGPAKAALERWADAVVLAEEADEWIRLACMYGDYYVIVDPQEEEAEGTVPIEASRPLGTAPTEAIMIYDRRSGRVAEYGLHIWESGSGDRKRTHATLFYDDATVKLISRPGTEGTAAIDFELDYDPFEEEPEDAWIFHLGGRKLMHHFPVNGLPYGTPVHRMAWGHQDAITKISANNLVNVDAQGLPSRWALIDPLAEIDDDIDDDFGTDGPATAPSKRDGMRDATAPTRVRAMPGAISMLRGVKAVGTFSADGPDAFLKNLDWYVRAMAVATGIALFEFDLNGEQPSGEARRRAEGRANRRAAKIKRRAETFFAGVADTVLGLAGMTARVSVAFNPSETSTDKDGLELVGLKVRNGVPLRQALREAGYAAEDVNAWYPESAPAIDPVTLSTLAEVLSKLGSAKTLGAITDEEIARMVPEIIISARGEGPVVEEDPLPGVVTDPATDLRVRFDALGVAIRAGVDQQQAAERLGLGGLDFPNLPTTIRVPEVEARGIEQA